MCMFGPFVLRNTQCLDCFLANLNFIGTHVAGTIPTEIGLITTLGMSNNDSSPSVSLVANKLTLQRFACCQSVAMILTARVFSFLLQ